MMTKELLKEKPAFKYSLTAAGPAAEKAAAC